MPSISLCMITKDEENNLRECLESARGIVDEIVIVDTGSTDKTKEIAKEFGAKVFGFEWGDDFSAARNESIKHATKDCILVLDADETIDEESARKIRESVNKEADAFQAVQKNYTSDPSVKGFIPIPHMHKGKTYAGWYGSFIARLFRNKNGYAFSGIVHELVEDSVYEKGGRIERSDIFINHYGNSSEKRKKKLAFYLELSKKKAVLSPSSRNFFELGLTYRENGLIDESLKCFLKALELNPKEHKAFFEIGVIFEEIGEIEKAVENYRASISIKETSDALVNLGVCELKTGNIGGAKILIEKAAKRDDKNYLALVNLGAIYEEEGRHDDAISVSKKAISVFPFSATANYNLGVAMDNKGEIGEALYYYGRAIELGHKKFEQIKTRGEEIMHLLNRKRHKF